MTPALWIIAIWIVSSVLFVLVGMWWCNRPVPRHPGYTVGGPETRAPGGTEDEL